MGIRCQVDTIRIAPVELCKSEQQAGTGWSEKFAGYKKSNSNILTVRNGNTDVRWIQPIEGLNLMHIMNMLYMCGVSSRLSFSGQSCSLTNQTRVTGPSRATINCRSGRPYKYEIFSVNGEVVAYRTGWKATVN